jgi:acyl-CoA reductase-like NAD-dependent aldehyde dehydrogenase
VMTTTSRTFTMTIGGEAVSGDDTFGVHNPATGEVFAEAPNCSRAQLDIAMESAQRAFAEWQGDVEQRRQVMYQCAALIEESAEEIGRIQTLEQGMPLGSSVSGVTQIAASFRSIADLEIPRLVIQDDENALVEVARRPIGVIAAIKAWNGPIHQAVGTIAPAFRAGCTVVFKPSPYTPLATLALGEILRPAVPEGVLNVISGSDPLGQWMVEHPIPRGVSFTGSIATGKRVNVAAAADLKRVLLELGGNDAAIVLDDVDPEELAKRIFWTAFANAGQVCIAVKRIFVPEALHDDIVSALARIAREVKVGDGFEEGVQMGPTDQRATVRSSARSSSTRRLPTVQSPSPVGTRSTDPGTSSNRRS